jgi:hypothetical protein
LTVNSPPLDTVGEQPSTGENIGGGRRFHLGFIAIGGHDRLTEPDGKIDQACRGTRSYFSSYRLSMAQLRAEPGSASSRSRSAGGQPFPSKGLSR